MDSKALTVLDGIYQRSLEADVSQADRQLVGIAMDKVVVRCDEFLAPTTQITNEQRAKFREIRHLATDEIRSAQTNCDILTHWILLRELIVDCDNWFGQNKSLDTTK